MISDPFSLKLAYLLTELQAGFAEELALVQIWTPTQAPFAGVPESKMDTQVMQTSHHPTLVSGPTFQEFRNKSCKQGITGQALGMLGKVWCSGVLQVVQDVSIVPNGVHPRNKLEHLRQSPGGPGLMELLAEIVYIPIYDETDPDTGVVAVLEVLLDAGGRESLLANVISGVGNVLAELQLSLSRPDPDAEVPEPGSLPPVLIPSESLDMDCPAPLSGSSSAGGGHVSPFADAPLGSFTGSADGAVPGGRRMGWGGGRSSGPPQSPPAVSPRQSSLRSYGTPPNPLVYGSPPTAAIRYGFLETGAVVPRPGSPPPCAASNVMAAMCDFAGLTVLQPGAGAAPPGACGWAAMAAREGPAPGAGFDFGFSVPPGPASAASYPPFRNPRPAPPAKQSQLTRTLSRTATAHMLDALEQEANPLPCPFSKAAFAKPCGGKGFAAQRQTLAAGL